VDWVREAECIGKGLCCVDVGADIGCIERGGGNSRVCGVCYEVGEWFVVSCCSDFEVAT